MCGWGIWFEFGLGFGCVRLGLGSGSAPGQGGVCDLARRAVRHHTDEHIREEGGHSEGDEHRRDEHDEEQHDEAEERHLDGVVDIERDLS